MKFVFQLVKFVFLGNISNFKTQSQAWRKVKEGKTFAVHMKCETEREREGDLLQRNHLRYAIGNKQNKTIHFRIPFDSTDSFFMDNYVCAYLPISHFYNESQRLLLLLLCLLQWAFIVCHIHSQVLEPFERMRAEKKENFSSVSYIVCIVTEDNTCLRQLTVY